MTQPHSPRWYLSPELVLGWSLWLLLSWAVNWAIDTPVWHRAESLAPAVRGLTQSMMIGIGLMWPAWRLSHTNREFVGRRTLVDLAWLLIVAQMVLWIVGGGLRWSDSHTLLVGAVVCVHGTLIAVIVWAGWRLPTGWGRAVAMAGCALVLGGGLLLTAATGEPEPARWSPLHMLWVMSEPYDMGMDAGGALRIGADSGSASSPLDMLRAFASPGAQGVNAAIEWRLKLIAIAGAGLWLALLLWRPRNRRAHRDGAMV